MNPILLAIESPHVRDEVAKILDTVETFESALGVAAELLALVGGEIVGLEGTPPADTSLPREWVDYLVVQGKVRLLAA